MALNFNPNPGPVLFAPQRLQLITAAQNPVIPFTPISCEATIVDVSHQLLTVGLKVVKYVVLS